MRKVPKFSNIHFSKHFILRFDLYLVKMVENNKLEVERAGYNLAGYNLAIDTGHSNFQI